MDRASGDAGTGGGRKRIVAVSVTAIAAMAAVGVAVRLPILQFGGRAVILAAAVFLYLPLPFILKSGNIAQYGISWGTGLRGLFETALLAVLVLTPFYIAFFLIFPVVGFANILPDHLARMLTIQLLVVALPEEFFFRGWLQTELDRMWNRSWKILGTDIGPGWITAAAFFAIVHLAADPRIFRTLVFFPGLLFGLLKSRTSSIVFPAIFHAVCNVTFIIALKAAGV